MPQSIMPATVFIDSSTPVNVKATDSDQQEEIILALAQLEKQAELVTGLELEKGDI